MNKFYLQEKGKLRTALSGLVRCLSLLPCDRREADSCEKVPPVSILCLSFGFYVLHLSFSNHTYCFVNILMGIE